MRLMTGLMTGVALATAAKAQPGDVNSIDIRVVRVPDQNTLELQLRPNNTWTFDDGVMNLTFAIRWESSAGGSLGMPSQDAPISSCMVATPLVLNPGTDNVLNNYDAGDGYRYRGFNAVGGQMDGSCSFPANTWVPYARVPVLGISDCATFEVVATSAHTTAYNSNWFISLGGVNITAASDVVGPGVTIGPAPATGSYGPVCSTGDPVSLNGGVPAGGTWSGTGVVDNEFYPAVGQGTYTLVYGVDGGGCIGYASTNIVVQQPPTAANAGTDQTVCASSTTLNASPVFVGTGMWSVISGSGDFADPTVRNTTVSDLSVGDNVFLWTTSNGSCPTSQDEVTITRQEATVWYADADGDGRGNAAVSQMACTQPTGYVADNTDCDDTDPGVWQTGDFYVDADSDGYTVGGLVSVCYGNTTPAGYSTTSNGTDCDDNNGAVWQSAVLHVDSDGDGYDAGTESVCFGVSIPVGYSATTNGSDCDDADPTVWHLANLYIDADGDGYDNGSATVCFGLSIPVGHSTTTNGSDCDDADPMAWQSALLYVDADGDGYDGGMENVCFGLSIPSGYISTSAGSDCNDGDANLTAQGNACDDNDATTENDVVTANCECHGTPIAPADTDGDGVPDDEDCAPNDPTAWQSASLYIDADGDGYDGGSTMVCFGASIPTGYSFTTNGTDCNDGDNTVWQSASLYIDADGDGYDGGSTVLCYGATAPAGYSLTTNGADCDDTDANLTMVGNACDDNDPATEDDVVDANCECHGTPPAPVACPGVRISQVYGGAGGTGAPYTRDFVELYNAGAEPAVLTGWSLQYANATGNFNSGGTLYAFPAGTTVAPGGYLLIAMSGSGSLPVVEDLLASSINMSATTGKVALVNTTSALGCGTTPCVLPDSRIVDLVGFGTATTAEGGAAAPAPSATLGLVRKSGGCQDTDNNAADFETVTASLMVLHNSASPTYACGLTLDIVDNVCPSTEGTIMASGCGAGTVLEYALSAEGPWSETAPTYTDENITVYVRCRTIATDCSGPVVSATTAPTDCAVLDCQGIPGGSALPGTPCDDGDPTTGNDTWTSECECAGVPVDCAGEPGGSALPGTPCDDGNPNTGDDTWSSDCECVGLPLDCAGVPGGDAQEDLCGQCLAGGPSNPQWNACVDCHGDVPQENVLALWTFETSVPTTAGPHTAESGLYAAGAAATSVGTAGFSNPVGNGTQESFSANNWNVGDYFQFAFATTGHEQIVLSWDQTRSGTGPDSFMLQWSADGVGFSDITNYTVGDVTWSGTTANPASSHSHALPAGAADLTTVWVRMTSLVDAATTGTSRIDNVRVSGTTPAASIDDCGVCSGGLTGIEPNSSCSDCAGVPNGPGQVDDCGVCREAGPSDPDWNSSCADCAGVPNGPGEVDDCGVCLAAGPSDPTWNSSCTDCAGVVNGEAYLDGCGICVGGTTGLEPCVVDCPVPDLYLDITLPANGTLPTWQIRDVTTNAVMQQGGGGAGFAGPNQEAICLDNGNYYLTVDGATAGTSYVLRTAEAESKRFIDNLAAATGPHQVQELANTNGTIQLPVSETRLINTSCDKYWWAPNEYIVVNEDPAVAAYWTGTAAEKAATGYDIWFYDPNGTYSYVRQRRHDQADGYGNVGSTRTCHARLNSTYHGWSSANHIPDGLELNVRVRSVVNGVPGNWGPACRFTLDAALAACPPTTLIKVPGHTNYSCGVTRQFTTANSQRLFAQPVSGKNRYEFQFRPAGAGEGTAWITRTMTTYYVNLGWNASTAPPLVAGTTYEVRVRAGYNDGSSTAWCAYGELCYVTITGGMTSGGQNSAMDDASPVFGLWPNPNRGDQLHLSLSEVQAGVGTITVDLYDLSGKRAAARTLPVQDGRVNTVLDLNGDLSAGMYIVHVLAGDAVYTERLVIQP
jgi:hypothetical protein